MWFETGLTHDYNEMHTPCRTDKDYVFVLEYCATNVHDTFVLHMRKTNTITKVKIVLTIAYL